MGRSTFAWDDLTRAERFSVEVRRQVVAEPSSIEETYEPAGRGCSALSCVRHQFAFAGERYFPVCWNNSAISVDLGYRKFLPFRAAERHCGYVQGCLRASDTRSTYMDTDILLRFVGS